MTAIPAIICGHIGRSRIKNSGGTLSGMGLATAGMVLGYISLALHLILIPAVGIPLFVKARNDARARLEHVSDSGHEIVSADGESRLVVPKDWSELKDLNEAAELQAGNRAKEQYVMVLSEKKADFTDMTLQKHHQLTREAMMKKMANPVAAETVDLIVDGHPALQEEINGTQEGVNIVFLHTTIDGDKSFHQILAWTSKSRWPKLKETLEEVTRSFRGGK